MKKCDFCAARQFSGDEYRCMLLGHVITDDAQDEEEQCMADTSNNII